MAWSPGHKLLFLSMDNEMNDEHFKEGLSWQLMLVIIAFYLIMQILLLFAYSISFNWIDSPALTTKPYISSILQAICCSFVIYLYYYLTKGIYNFSIFPLKIHHDVVSTFLIIVIILIITTNSTFPMSFSKKQTLIFGPTHLAFLDLFAICILNPVVDEIFYRAFLLNELIKNYSKLSCILITSILFSIINADLTHFIPCFIFSVMASGLYIKRNSIYNCVILHICNNLLAITTT